MKEVAVQKKLIKTLFSRKPSSDSFFVAAGMIGMIALTSYIYWQPQYEWASEWAANRGDIYTDGKYWQIFTAMMIHGDFAHLLSNAYMLFIFSFFIFGYFGFKVYPLISLLLGALTNALSILTYPVFQSSFGAGASIKVKLLGASGLVYVLGGFWLTMFLFVQRQHAWPHRILRVLGVGLMVLFPSTFEPNVSYQTHAIGFVIGALFAAIYFAKNKDHIRSFEEYKIEYEED